MLKAVSGGGGRGIRPVAEGEDLTEAFTRCSRRRKRPLEMGLST